MRRRGLLGLALAAPAASAVTGCGVQVSAKPARFTDRAAGTMHVYGWQATDDVGLAREAHVGRELSGVTIDYDRATFDAQKFTTLLASGDVPDVVVMNRQFVGTYAAKGLIRPLDDGFAVNGVDARKTFYPATLADVTYQGHVYGVPQFFQPAVILGNKRVMDRHGIRPDDLNSAHPDRVVAAAHEMYSAPGGHYRTIGLYPSVEENLVDWILAFGGHLIGADGSPTLDHPGNVAAFRFLSKLFAAEGGYADTTSYFNAFDPFGADNEYVRDQAGAVVYEQWYPNVLTATAKKVSIVAIPLRDRHGAPIAVSNGTAFVVPATSKNPSAGMRWALGVTSVAAWMAAARARMHTIHTTPGSLFTGLMTASRTADDTVHRHYLKPTGHPDFDQVISVYYDVLRHSASIGTSAAGLTVRTELNNAAVQAFTGRKSVATALSDAQNAAAYGYDKA